MDKNMSPLAGLVGWIYIFSTNMSSLWDSGIGCYLMKFLEFPVAGYCAWDDWTKTSLEVEYL